MIYVDTKNQLADILTKGSFTRDEWDNMLHLFNIMNDTPTATIMHNSGFSCTLFRQINEPRAMSKRQMQEGTQGLRDIWSL